MTLWPGDVLKGDDGGEFVAQRLVTYQGKKDCESWQCTRRGSHQRPDGSWDLGECFGYHCALCDEPCSMMGHDCPRAGDVAA